MFILQATQKAINIYAPYTDPVSGVHGIDLTRPENREACGIIEIPDPLPPADYSEDTYYRNEQDEAPYVIYTRKSPEQLAAVALSRAKQERLSSVEDIHVTTASGKVFDGDEVSQGRMARAIIVLSAAGGTANWVLADNTVAQVTAAELTEALALAGAEQARVWILPYA